MQTVILLGNASVQVPFQLIPIIIYISPMFLRPPIIRRTRKQSAWHVKKRPILWLNYKASCRDATWQASGWMPCATTTRHLSWKNCTGFPFQNVLNIKSLVCVSMLWMVLVLLTFLNCYMSTLRLVHYALLLTPACRISSNTDTRVVVLLRHVTKLTKRQIWCTACTFCRSGTFYHYVVAKHDDRSTRCTFCHSFASSTIICLSLLSCCLCVCVCARARACARVCLCVSAHVCLCARARARVFVCMCVCVCVSACVRVCVCVCVCVDVHLSVAARARPPVCCCVLCCVYYPRLNQR